MPSEYTVVRRVEFSETDLAGIMHFSNYFKFMETAEHAFFRSLGFSVVLAKSHPGLCLPRVHAECDFQKPLRFEDEVEVRLRVAEKKPRTLTYEFQFRRLNGPQTEAVARGRVTVACAQRQPDGTLKAVPLPADIASRITVAPEAQRAAGGSQRLPRE